MRYNKKNPVNYNFKNLNEKHNLLGTDASDILLDIKNNIIVLNVFAGISCINTQTGEVFKKIRFDKNKNLFGDANFTKFDIIDSSVFLVGTNGKIIKYNLFSEEFSYSESLKINNIEDRVEFVKCIDSKIFIGFTSGLIAVFNNDLVFLCSCSIILNTNSNEVRLNSFEKIPNSSKYIVATSYGFKTFNFSLNKLSLFNEVENKVVKSNNALIYCSTFYKGKLYYCTDNGLYSVDTSNYYLVEKIEEQSSNGKNYYAQSYQIFCDDDYALIGSFNGFTEVNLNTHAFSSIRKNSTNLLLLDHCIDLNLYDKSLWVTATNGILKYDINSNQIKNFDVKSYSLNVLKLPNKQMMISGSNGLKILKEEKFINAELVFKELKKVSNLLFSNSIVYKDSLVFLAAEFNKGLFVWDFFNHSVEPISKEKQVNAIITNSLLLINDTLLIVSEKSILIFDIINRQISNHVLIDTSSKQEISVFMDAVKNKHGYWFAVYGLGIVNTDNNFKVKKIIDNKNGISNLGLYKIFSIGDSLILVSSNNGLFYYNIVKDKVKAFFEIDGIHGNIFEEFSGTNNDSIIIVGGINGLTFINSRLLKENSLPPSLYFQEINIETDFKKIDTTNLLINKIEIPNNYTQIKISFIGLNNQKEERVNYWYRITELGTNWIDLKNQNFIDLIGISPGKYHLEVKAANEDGVECAPIIMELHFLPKWYQTLGFKILVALLIAGLLFILYTFRIKQLKKVLAVRKKISQNLHDDIGSTLSAINMYTQVAKLQPQENHFLNSIEENTKDVLGKLDDIIWSTNPKNDKVQNLVERMDAFARPLCNAHNINFIFEQNNIGTAQKISESIRQNIFIIFKEAINNALKYAQCKNITVVLEEKNKNIACSITDDGIGFEPSKPTERNGLLNMQIRAKELKGICTITSEINKGSVVFIQLPV